MPNIFKHKALNVRNSEVINIIEKLHGMRTVKAKMTESPIERLSTKGANWMLVFAAILLAILGGLGLWHSNVRPLNEHEKVIAIQLGCIAIILPVISILLNLVTGLWILVKFQKKSLQYFLIEIENDQSHVCELAVFPKKDLEDAKKIIQLKIIRIKNRLGIFLGAPDKVALFSLAAMGWSVIKEFSSKEIRSETISILQFGSSLNNLLHYMAAFFAGIAIGAVLLNRQMQRYVYQSELLDITISRKEEIDND
jgi:TRAP-type C4-dicarboxylate transport system permease small subunit